MTKEEMLSKYSKAIVEYDKIQQEIAEAMSEGKTYIYVFKEGFGYSHFINFDTVLKLRNDGFDVNAVNYDEWEISW